MASISVVINTATSGPFNVAQLFAGNTYSGAVTVPPATPLQPQSKPLYMSIQADPANGSELVYVGDENIAPATAGAAGQVLVAGATTQVQNVEQAIAQRYVSASANGAVLHIEVLGGFQ